MKCQNCGVHEANIKYMQMINGEKDEMYLCDKCAKDMKIDMNFDMHFGFDNVFASLFGAEPMVKPVELSDELKCDACGMRYDDFAHNGMMGCPNCYRVFSKRLDTVIKKLHGSNRHVENTHTPAPKVVRKKESNVKEQIEELKQKIEQCIKTEDYEQAAILRDKIKSLEKKLDERERGE